MAKRVILWVLAILGSIIFWILLIHWTTWHVLETGIPFVYIGGVFLFPLAFWLWGKIVKPFGKKYIPVIILGIATIIFIINIVQQYQGVKYLEMYNLR